MFSLRWTASSLFLILFSSPTVHASQPWRRALFESRGDDVLCAAGPQLSETIRGAIADTDCPQTNGFQFDATKGKVTVDTILAVDTAVKNVTDIPPDSTCGQAFDPGILVRVLQVQGGLCDTLAQLGVTTEADQQPFLQPFIDIVNAPENLVFLTDAVEQLKPPFITKFRTNITATAEIANPIEFIAMSNYFVKSQGQANNTAAKLDDALKNAVLDGDGNVIPVNGNFLIEWGVFLGYANDNKKLTQTAANAKILEVIGMSAEIQRRSQVCGAPPGTPAAALETLAATLPSTGSTVPKMRRTFVTPTRRLLERRAPRTPTSGPRAPATPSCPVNGETRKKAVPRSEAVVKQPTGTFKVAQQDSVRPNVSPSKRTPVPRPSDRPRRTPGKAVPPVRRVTPAKKPKVVPKPDSKAKGRPRARARGRR